MNFENGCVYVIDDEPSVRKSIHRLIKSAGIKTMLFTSAKEFLEHNLADIPGCLILDYQMPDMNGLALQNALASRGIEIPIIFITGHGTVPVSVQAMKVGAIDFLEKPIEEKVLIDAVFNALDIDMRRRSEQCALHSIQSRFALLTPRERDVLRLVVTGMLNKQVAGELGISEKTVKVHRASVMKKMSAESLAELVLLAERIGIAKPHNPSILD